MDATQQTRTAVPTGSQSQAAGAAIKALALASVAAGVILVASALAGVGPLGGSSGSRLVEDRSYDTIESARGFVAGTSEDRAYDAIERARGGVVVTVSPEDHSYDAIEQIRGGSISD